MNRIATATSIVFSLALFAAAPSAANAGGLFLPGYGSQAQPRAGAFTAKADDPTALFHNPAGLAKQHGTAIHLGFNFVDFSQTFQREGTYETDPLGAHAWDGEQFAEVENEATPSQGIGSIAAIPFLAVSTDLGLDTPFRFGAGVFAGHGYPFRDYGADYTFEDPNTPPPPARYDIVEQTALIAHFAVAASYSINETLSVGVELVYGIAELEARKHVWAVRNYEEAANADGEVIFDAKDNFVPSFDVGVLWSPMPMLEVGANYRSQSSVRAKGTVRSQLGTAVGIGGTGDMIIPDGEARCQEGGTVAAVRGCLDVNIPQSATIGARYILRDGGLERADIEFDVRWEDWSNASDYIGVVDGRSQILGRRLETVVTRHGLKDTFSFRLGGAYNLPLGANLLSFRGGVAHDTAAAPLGFTRLDLDGFARTTLGAGGRLQLLSLSN